VHSVTKKISISTVLMSVFLLFLSATVSAHVVVSPKEVLTAQRTTFALSVPNESDVSAVVGVRLVIPEGLSSVTPFAKAGWTIEMVKNGEGEEAVVSEINWTSAGSNVPVSLKDEFLFGAKAPVDTSELIWKAYETYSDGMVVAWDQEPSDAEDNMPYSVTKVVNETAQETAVNEANQSANDAQNAANQALYIAVAGLVVGFVAVFLATRKK
jgi:uncharacterized protein YcnI